MLTNKQTVCLSTLVGPVKELGKYEIVTQVIAQMIFCLSSLAIYLALQSEKFSENNHSVVRTLDGWVKRCVRGGRGGGNEGR